MKATSKQTWMLFCLTKKDWRHEDLTVAEASQMISDLQDKKEQEKEDLINIVNEAKERGIKAGNDHNPRPMDVTDGKQTWHVSEGVCGFAWVHCNAKGNTKLARFLKDNCSFSKSYHGGVDYHIPLFSQSYERKMEHARAMAKYLNDNIDRQGISFYADGRLD